ncbi:MAG: zf-HC2 domain-containing protein, partial [Candidatus Omnitrophica bacterium]|nr:zf-HC2 domain-containing protein [Candidatus Omnitrophota bacterium]
MNCEEVKKILSDYLADSLNSDYNNEIKGHLDECKECTDCFRALVETDNIVKLIANEEPSEEYWDNYLPKFKSKLGKDSTPKLSENRSPFHLFTPKFSFVFNGVLLAFLILLGALLYRNNQQTKLLQIALLEKQAETIHPKTTTEFIMPVVSRQAIHEDTMKNTKLFQEISDMFPKTIQWVVASDGQIELGLSKNTLASKAITEESQPIFLKFNIMRTAETPELVSSASMMVLNGNEVNAKLWGVSETDYTTYRYHCLPLLRTDGKIDVRIRVSLDNTSLETELTANEGDNVEVGRLRKADAEYSIYLNVVSKGIDIVK